MSNDDTSPTHASAERLSIGYVIGLLVLSGMFWFSVLAKLHDLRNFEFLLSQLQLVDTSMGRQVVSRLVVVVELVIAAGLWLPGRARQQVLGLTAAFLFAMTVGMFYAHVQGSEGNCGCFGSVLEMSPLMAAIKNIPFTILALVLMWHAPTSGGQAVALPAMTVVIALGVVFGLPLRQPPTAKPAIDQPGIPPGEGSDTEAVVVSVDTDVPRTDSPVAVVPPVVPAAPSPFAGFAGFQPVDVDITQGEVFVAFVSLECEHCQELVRDLTVRQMGLPAPVVLVCLGDESEYPSFQRTTRSEFPWLIAPPLDFMDMIGDAPPRLYLLRNGQPLKVWEGDHVDTDIVIAEATDLVGAR